MSPDETQYPTASPQQQVPIAYAPPASSPAQAPSPAPRPNRGCLATALIALLGGLVGAVVVALLFVAFVIPTSSETSTSTSGSNGSGISITTNDSITFVEAVAAKVTPSVVSIGVQQTGIDPFTGQRVTQTVGNGSGVIIRANGYILTNNHVVEGADGLTVKFGVDELPATVVGTDPSTDLAVIKVDASDLPAIEFGSSADLVVGEPVVAVGSPFGLDQTVTSGIVSALGRSSFMESASAQLTAYTSLIQTDAAINPGNSGGALVDAKGRLIGINTLIQTGGSDQSAGVGFAIPIDFAKGIADDIIATGKAQHPFLGVSSQTVTASMASQYDLPVSSGAIVSQVTVGSPAEAAGIEANDIIVSIGGEDVRTVEDVFIAIRSHKVGDEVDVDLVRGTSRLTVKATLASDATRQ